MSRLVVTRVLLPLHYWYLVLVLQQKELRPAGNSVGQDSQTHKYWSTVLYEHTAQQGTAYSIGFATARNVENISNQTRQSERHLFLRLNASCVAYILEYVVLTTNGSHLYPGIIDLLNLERG